MKKAIDEQGKLTDELTIKIASTMILSELEDIYRPYQQKTQRQTHLCRQSRRKRHRHR